MILLVLIIIARFFENMGKQKKTKDKNPLKNIQSLWKPQYPNETEWYPLRKTKLSDAFETNSTEIVLQLLIVALPKDCNEKKINRILSKRNPVHKDLPINIGTNINTDEKTIQHLWKPVPLKSRRTLNTIDHSRQELYLQPSKILEKRRLFFFFLITITHSRHWHK